MPFRTMLLAHSDCISRPSLPLLSPDPPPVSIPVFGHAAVHRHEQKLQSLHGVYRLLSCLLAYTIMCLVCCVCMHAGMHVCMCMHALRHPHVIHARTLGNDTDRTHTNHDTHDTSSPGFLDACLCTHGQYIFWILVCTVPIKQQFRNIEFMSNNDLNYSHS